MDIASITPMAVQALGGLIGSNILGALTRGGGGVIGRSLVGIVAGLGAGYAAENVAAVGDITKIWGALVEGDAGAHLSNLITGAAGGGALGLITGIMIRPRG